jgi:hypothetical protein
VSNAPEQRKLAAIMFTDTVGYSALSQRDDKLALELLEEHRELLMPKSKQCIKIDQVEPDAVLDLAITQVAQTRSDCIFRREVWTKEWLDTRPSRWLFTMISDM